MLTEILEQFALKGVVRMDGDRITFMHQPYHPGRVDNLIIGSKVGSAVRNYGVNLVSGGLVGGLEYGYQKVARSIKANRG